MATAVLDFFREQDPKLKKVPDEELTRFVGDEYPEFLKDPDFKKEYGEAGMGHAAKFIPPWMKKKEKEIPRPSLEPVRADEDFPLETEPKAPEPSPEQPPTEAVGQLEGLAAAFERGWKQGSAMVDVVSAVGERESDKPTMRQRRRAFEMAMKDPRYQEGGIIRPEVEAVRGPASKLDMLMAAGQARKIATIQDVARLQREIGAIPQSEAQKRLAQAKTQGEKWQAWLHDPIELTATIAAESLPPSLAGAFVGTVVGGPGVGTAAGAGAASGLMTFSSELLGNARNLGYDIGDPEQLNSFLTNEKDFNAAMKPALLKSTIVGGVDAATAGLAGRFLAPALAQGLKQTVIASGKELAMQAAGGAGGELAGQVATGQKVDWFDVAMEAVAEVASGPMEIYGNIRDQQKLQALAPQTAQALNQAAPGLLSQALPGMPGTQPPPAPPGTQPTGGPNAVQPSTTPFLPNVPTQPAPGTQTLPVPPSSTPPTQPRPKALAGEVPPVIGPGEKKAAEAKTITDQWAQRAADLRAVGNVAAAEEIEQRVRERVAEEIGFEMKPGLQIGSMQLTDEQVGQIRKIAADKLAQAEKLRAEGKVAEAEKLEKEAKAATPQREFTDHRPGSPTKSLSFYVLENATPEEIRKAHQAKLEEAKAGGFTPPPEKPVLAKGEKEIGVSSTGQPLFETETGERFYFKDGKRQTSRTIERRAFGNKKLVVPMQERRPEFSTKEELAELSGGSWQEISKKETDAILRKNQKAKWTVQENAAGEIFYFVDGKPVMKAEKKGGKMFRFEAAPPAAEDIPNIEDYRTAVQIDTLPKKLRSWARQYAQITRQLASGKFKGSTKALKKAQAKVKAEFDRLAKEPDVAKEVKKRKKPVPEEAPPDIITDLEDAFGGKINLADIQRNKDWKPVGAAKKFFSKAGKWGWDEVHSALQGNPKWKDLTFDEFLEAINAAAQARLAAPKKKAGERKATSREEKQQMAFDDIARLEAEGKTEPTYVDDLGVGDTFTIEDVPFKVTQVTPETITIEDGNRFGTRTLFSGDTIQIDKGSLVAAPIVEDKTFEEAAEEAAAQKKLAAEEAAKKKSASKTHDELKAKGEASFTGKFKEGDEIIYTPDPLVEKFNVRGKPETKERKGKVFFAGEGVYSIQLSDPRGERYMVPETALRAAKEAAAAKVGDTITFTPSSKYESPVTGEVTDVIQNQDGETGYQIHAPLPGDPARIVRVWASKGTVKVVPKPAEEMAWSPADEKRLKQLLNWEKFGDGLRPELEKELAELKAKKKRSEQKPKRKVEQRPLTKAEQAEFKQLSLKIRANREAGGPPLTTAETQRYEFLTALAGQEELLGEDKNAGVRARIKQLQEKAAEMDRLRLRTEERAFKSKARRAEFLAEAATYAKEAQAARDQAAELESQLEGRGREEQGGLFESRIPRTENIFEMDEADLADFFDSMFGEQPGPAQPGELGRAGVFSFPTYEAFAKWMDERYAERDIEGMRLAFAEAPTAHKTKYVRDNIRTANDHKKAWIFNIGTDAPLPAVDPPVPRTTPRPLPGGGSQPVPPSPGPAQPPQPPTPGQTPPNTPPPPPRANTPYRKFDIMALVQLLRQFNRFPVVNERLRRAYGRLVEASELVEIKTRLLWDTALAERVLGHEVGHFIDLIVRHISIPGTPVFQRLRPFHDFTNQIAQQIQLRDMATALSAAWRGPFGPNDQYRNDPRELMADFMSAMFNNPEWVNQNFPVLHDLFQEYKESKPQFKSLYREIETWLQGGTMVKEWRTQQEEASERTQRDLLAQRQRPRASFKDILMTSFVTVWYRAFQREGQRRVGRMISDELEYSNSWAATLNSLFADDFKKFVEPFLARVHKDMGKARAILHGYAQAKRTIGERRAAGVWIENNPNEARDMLQSILNLDPTLNVQFGVSLANATNDQLYDLAAVIFREVHDRGDEYVARMERHIDNLQSPNPGGHAALMAFNVRGKLLNPGGLTPDHAQEAIDQIENDLTPAQFAALQQASNELVELFYQTQRRAYEDGLISKKVWDELIEPNRDNYVPYAVLDYWDAQVRAGVMPQKGTVRDVADVTLAAQLKAASLHAWRQKQRQVKLLMDAYNAGGIPVVPGERLRESRDIEQVRARNPHDDVSRAVYFVDGQPHVVEFPNDPGRTLEAAMQKPSFYERMQWIENLGKWTHRLMQFYTTFSLPFLIWRNPIRGFRTTALKVGFARAAQRYGPEFAGLVHALTTGDSSNLSEAGRLAYNYAQAAFGAQMDPELRTLVERQMLLPPRLSSAMVRDLENLGELLESGGILAFQVRPFLGTNRPLRRFGATGRAVSELGRETFRVFEQIFTAYEAFEKIAAYQAAMAGGATQAEAVGIGRRSGIPKPGVGGHLTLPMEVFFPWTRVHLQGARSTYDMLRDPEKRKGFVVRFMITEALPRVLKVLVGAGVAAGLVKWAASDDDDPEDPVMAEVFCRVSPYKMALDDIIPFAMYDPRTGKYHWFSDFKSGKEIPDHYEVVSLRLPASEEGRLWGTALYKMLTNMPQFKEMGKPDENVITGMGHWAANYLMPGISPAIEINKTLYKMILEGKNPDDPYTGQPSANPRLFDAGGMDRAQAITGYTLNQLGGPGEMAAVLAMTFGILDKRTSDALKKRLASDKQPLVERIPVLKSAVSYDNYANYRTEKLSTVEEERIRAKARLIMSDEVRGMYDFYYRNLKRSKKLQGADLARFEIAAEFVNDVWGNLYETDEEGAKHPSDSWYAKAAHAVGKDGSKMAKETVKRDLDTASAGLLFDFENQK